MKRGFPPIGGIAVLLLVAMLWMSWPLAMQGGEVLTSGRADGDLGYTLSAHWWAGEVLSGQAGFPTNDKVYFPHGQNMAGSVWNFVPLFLSAWPHWFLDPLSAYHAGLLFLMLLNGLAAAALGARLGGVWGAVGASCTLLAFPYPWAEAFEGRLEQAFLAPAVLVFWAAVPFRESPRDHALSVGLLMGLVAASYWFYAPIVALGLALFLGSRLRSRETLLGLLKAIGYALLAVLPFFLLVQPALEGGAFAQATADTQHILFTRVGQSLSPWESFSGILGPDNLGRTLPLVGTLGLLAASAGSPRARRWALIALLGAAFAMGPVVSQGNQPWVVSGRMIPLPFALLDAFPVLERFWWPYRFMALIGIAAAAAIALLFAQLRSQKGHWAPILLSAVLLIEGRVILTNAVNAGDPSIPASSWDPQPRGPFFHLDLPEWILHPPESGAILEFPMAGVANSAPLYAPFHQLPTAHGDGIREAHIRPRAFEESLSGNAILSAWARGENPPIAEEALSQLHTLGFRHILVHTPRDPEPSLERENQTLLRRLETTLGPPSHREPTLQVFAIPSTRQD